MPIPDNTHISTGTCSNELHYSIGKTTESCLHSIPLHTEVSSCLSKCCDNTGMTPPAAGLVKGSVFVVVLSIHISHTLPPSQRCCSGSVTSVHILAILNKLPHSLQVTLVTSSPKLHLQRRDETRKAHTTM